MALTSQSKQENSSKPSVFEYQNALVFLESCILYFQSYSPAYTFRSLSTKLGFKSPNYLQQILKGTKSLSNQTAKKLTKILKLNSEETEFFLLLADLCNIGASKEEKALLLEKLSILKMKRNTTVASHEELPGILEYHFNSIIIEAISLFKGGAHIEQLTELLKPKLSSQQISDSLNSLLKTGWLKKNNAQLFEAVAPNLVISRKSSPAVVKRANAALLNSIAEDFEKNAFDKTADQGNTQADILTFAFPLEQMQEIKSYLLQVSDNIAAKVSNFESENDSVAQIGVVFSKIASKTRAKQN